DRSRLKEDAVPSIFTFNASNEESSREKRFKKRQTHPENLIPFQEIGCQQEVEVSTESELVDCDECPTEEPALQHQGIQCEIPTFGKLSVESVMNNDKIINYYTGFQDYNHFMMFFHCLGPRAYELTYQCSLLHPKDQLFMTLVKLRQDKEDVELSMLFNVSASTVSRIIITWINFMYFQLKEINFWPSPVVIHEHMPQDFKSKFPNTRVILDATEISIERPSHVNCQSVTWSNYKHKNTLKTMIGCSPKGAITFISDSYGGSASDRQKIEKSCLLEPTLKLFEKGDSIMADRGIMVQDLFANQDVHINTPTLLKGKSQLDPDEVVHDRRVTSKRIHIERVMGLSKSFKILKHGISKSKLQLGSRIIFICFAISNFRRNIVPKNA
ncbi:uncharacterized protein LOC134261311, partial [Saccostrea cucullata]|uniref:uncharacterized protein LOC134261311 n=1 Tax=Saccostrea cuccullata TaxID=36930 RepID=UPI002ED3F366